MTARMKQAGFLRQCRVAAGVAFLTLMGSGAVFAEPPPDSPKLLEDLMPDFLSAKAAAPKGDAKAATDEAPAGDVLPLSSDAPAPAKPAASDAAVPVHKLTPPPAAPQQPKPMYRVYASPAMTEDQEPPRRIDPMPPLDVPPDAAAMDGMAEGRAPLLATRNLQDAAAPAVINNQFFPLLPLNAGDDAAAELLPVASNHALSGDRSRITRAIIYIHDIARDASEGITAMTTLAGNANEQTMLLAPQFPLGIDVARFAPHLPDEGRTMARWSLIDPLRSWQIGGDSVTGSTLAAISSFTALDLLMLYLADKNAFPVLQTVIIAGHGMGADYVLRYAAIGQAPDLLAAQKITVRFVAANANSYLYLTDARPAPGQSSFAPGVTALCPAANDYPYGLDKLVPYARRFGANAIRMNAPARHVTLLASDRITVDTLLDDNCAAMAEGRTRAERAQNFVRYLASKFGDSARDAATVAVVPAAGYDPVALFGSYCGMAMLFGDGDCKGGGER